MSTYPIPLYSTAGLQRVKFGKLERYGEVLSGAFIALVGLTLWVFPVMLSNVGKADVAMGRSQLLD
jgi:hypothetical protein